jgi:hypothetical protein
MIGRSFAVLATALLLCPAARAESAEACKPQPDCRIAYSSLKPGAPRTPLNLKDRERGNLGPNDVHLYDAPEDRLRIPSAPK